MSTNFSGKDDAYVWPQAIFDGEADRSFAFWYRATSITDKSHNYYAWQKQDKFDFGGFAIYRPQMAPDRWRIQFNLNASGIYLETEPIIQAGRWEFLAVLFNRDAEPKIYHAVDAVTLVEPTRTANLYPGATTTNPILPRMLDDASVDLMLGNSVRDWNESFDGDIGPIAYVSKTSAQTVTEHFPYPHFKSNVTDVDNWIVGWCGGAYNSNGYVDMIQAGLQPTISGSPTWVADDPPIGSGGWLVEPVPFVDVEDVVGRTPTLMMMGVG